MFNLRIVALFGSLLLPLFSHARETVVIDAEDSWAPYSSEVKGKAQGYSVDMVKAIFNAANVDVEFRPVSYAKCLNDLTHAPDVIGCFDTARDAANENLYNWPQHPLFQAKVLIWARNDFKGSNLSFKDLIGKKVGVTNRYEYGSDFDKSTQIQKDEGKTNHILFQKLNYGRFDFAVAYEYPAKYTLKSPEMAAIKSNVKPVGVLSDLPLYVSFSKTKPESAHFLDLYNKGYEIISKNGTLKKLEDELNALYR
jgi:polar amino acid transport system substrate-binding protein